MPPLTRTYDLSLIILFYKILNNLFTLVSPCRFAHRNVGRVGQLQHHSERAQTTLWDHESGECQMATSLRQTVERIASNATSQWAGCVFQFSRAQRIGELIRKK